MAAPYAYWPPGTGGTMGGMPSMNMPMSMGMPMRMMGGMGGMMSPFGAPYNIAYGIPSIPPSSNPLIVNPEGAIRDFAEHATNADRKQMCTVWDLKCLEDWGKDEEHRKVIMEVIKSRLELAWPHNYKALDVLSVMPVGETVGLIDKIKSFAESPNTVEGGAELKKIAKPILEKAEGEKKKMEEEEMKKKQEAVVAMWGGLWANDHVRQPGALAASGYYGWQYPYQVVPGVPAQSGVEWRSKAPEGWSPSSITAVPQVYPFSRSGYYALIPPDAAPPDPPKASPYTITVTPGVVAGEAWDFTGLLHLVILFVTLLIDVIVLLSFCHNVTM